MADNNRRNRRPSAYDSTEDFDWDEYDKLTSGEASDAPRRTRRQGSQPQRSGSQSSRHAQSAAPRKRRRKKKPLTEKQRLFRRRIRLIIFAALFIIVIIGAGLGVGMYAAVSREIKDMNLQNLALNYSSFIYYEDEGGNEQELEQIQSEFNRIWIDSSQIPQVMKDAMVSIEDERFYKHHGVDLKRTLGATGKWALSKIGIGSADYGGSTITQQVIKNITNENEATATRKVKEMMRAIALEKQLTKDEILTMYLNIVYFANNCNGVEAASKVYFDKSAIDLSLEEAASIAGITQFPSEYDPFVHPDKNIEKRNLVLSKMLELGYINDSEYAMAASSNLVVTDAHRESMGRVTSYFVDQVVSDVINDLVEQKGYSSDFATQQVYNGGLKIYATIDPKIQGIMEDVFTDTSNFPYTGRGAQSAMVVIDPYTGKVRGLIGGLGEKTDIRGWNRATQSVRQPGSSIKPLSVYSPAIDTGKITEVTTVTDEEITIGDDKWSPKNAYSGFKGDMTVKEAVARSSNIPAVKVLDMVGVSTSFGYLQNKFHLSTLVEGDKNYSSLALGGLTQGVTVEDMAGAYAAFVNSGKYIKPHTYSRVLDSTGQIILENNSNPSQAISAASAYITADLLYGVVNNSLGTGQGAKVSGMPTYGKTGTTDDDCDKWFVGFTPYYVGACWYGFDTPASISDAGVSGNPTVTAWNLVMERIHESLNPKELTKPANVVEAVVCEKSGMLATATCPEVIGYFVEGTQPKAMCDSSHASREKDEPTPSPSASTEPTTPADVTTAPATDVTVPSTSSDSSSNSSSGISSSSSSGSSSSTASDSSSGSSSASDTGIEDSGTSSEASDDGGGDEGGGDDGGDGEE